MKSTYLLILLLLFVEANVNAQTKSDIGIRYSGNNFNLFQVEFRKPLNDFYAFRFSLTKGRLWATKSSSSVLFESDSLIVFRNYDQTTNFPIDMRFGVERKLKWNLLSVHSDLVFGYYNLYERATSKFRLSDDQGFTYEPNGYSSEVPDEFHTAAYGERSWNTDYVSGGLALGIALDVPFYHFILGINAQYIGTIGLPVSEQPAQSPDPVFETFGGIQYHSNFSAGVILRYVFGKKKKV